MSSVLVIEDNRTIREAVEITLGKMGLAVSVAGDGQGALEQLKSASFDLVVSDYRLPGGLDGLEVFRQARQFCPGVDFIFITAYGTVDLAVEAMKLGAAEFLTKPFSPDELRVRVEKVLESRRHAAERQRLAEENERLKSEVAEAGGFGELVGESAAMQKVFATIDRVAASDASVLIIGESGTGKELVARQIHVKSSRAGKPFIKLACAALSEGVLESELFGHEKGAFTGSVKARKGRFELADGGTLFLDEIGDISPAVQVKLLRVLQEREFERVGGEKTISVDVRLVSATNKDLKSEVGKGTFREDLFYRLHVVPVELPPLRERAGDIPLLARHLAEKISRRMNRPPVGIEPEALALLAEYTWPGNVRELENVIERAMVLGAGPAIRAEDIPPLPRRSLQPEFDLPEAGNIDLAATLEGLERRIIEQAYRRAGGNKSHTARLLGIRPNVLYYKLDKYGLR